MQFGQHVLFLFCVALASYAQNLTGFAFGLILLGLVAVLHLASLADTANVVSFLVLANALMTFGRSRPQFIGLLFWPALLSSLVGVGIGVWVLSWLSTQAVNVLRLALGCAIIVCALLLVVRVRAKTVTSPMPSFLFFSGLSGVMGGLFASAGPPMVYHLYRQPWRPELIRHYLILLFAANAVLRLALVAGSGQFNFTSVLLSLEALPVVLALTWMARRYPSRWSVERVKRAVFVLLLLAGSSLVFPSLGAMMRH